MINIPFNNSYVNLGSDFYVKTHPVPVKSPTLIKYNHDLAITLGINPNFEPIEGLAVLAGNVIAKDSEPIAMVYAGHQFGGFNPQLGDGRALLLGEIISPKGIRYDIQLKGSGPTTYSRNGDGRSALGPVLREFLVSEAMVKLGVPTTRALAAVTTGEMVARTGWVAGGILTRVATGFVRVGTFQYFASNGQINKVKKLADYVIHRTYPEVKTEHNPYLGLLKAVTQRQASLIAQWMQLGFIHGVMNTDNMSIMGETIDYGPCAFMDTFHHNQVYSSIDHHGRYAYNNQPSIGQWNLSRFAETLLPLLADPSQPPKVAIDIAQDILERYIDSYHTIWLAGMCRKIGLTKGKIEDKILINDLLHIMERNHADFTLTFYYLSQLENQPSEHDKQIYVLFSNEIEMTQWLVKWRQRLAQENLSNQMRQKNMLAVNPLYIPRNHQIEAAIRAAEDEQDFSVFHALHKILQTPYKWQANQQNYMQPPRPEEVVQQTFCGT